MRSLAEIRELLNYVLGLCDVENLGKRVSYLESEINDPSFWNDRKRAALISEEHKNKETLLKNITEISESLGVYEELFTSGENVEQEVASIENALEKIEMDLMFSDEFDENNALIEIHPGAGGVESNDWADMLFRMYTRFAELEGLKLTVIDKLDNEGFGIKSVSLEISGKHAYGMLKGEKGVHRLVRISPFDSNSRRHTSFASVLVTPIIEDDGVLEIPEKDLRVDTYRSQGAGGQNVNKVESAVRITHIPTNIAVAVQTERSQHQNRDIAMRNLRSKLLEHERMLREQKMSGIIGGKNLIEWGSQIRSYVLCPYTLAKDHRTGFEVGDVSSVLEGNLDGFIREYLKYTKKGGKNNEN